MGDDAYEEQLISLCVEYLTDNHTVLWGQYWDVSDEAQRDDAARWLAEQIDGVAALTLGRTTATASVLRPGAIGAVRTGNGKRKPLCLVLRSPQGSIECQQAYGHKGDHAGQGKNGRWYKWGK